MKYLIIGIGKSGKAVSRFLSNKGIDYDFYDDINDVEYIDNHPVIHKCESFKEKYDKAIISPGISIESDVARCVLHNGVEIIGELELAYENTNSDVIAITGTNGKTTTTSLVGHIIKKSNIDAEIVGNIGTPFLDKVEDNAQVYVVETSSFQLETIREFRPKIAAILNLTPDHLDRHKTFENYIKAKLNITRNQNDKDALVLNKDCTNISLINISTNAKIIYFSRKEKTNGAYLEDDKIYFNNELICNKDIITLVGDHNIENILAAISICKLYGINNNDIIEGIKSFKAVKHRLEFVKEIKGVKYFNDSKGTNPDAAIKAIEAMKWPTYLIAGGYNKNSQYDDWLKVAKNHIKKLILMGETANDIRESALDVGVDENEIIIVNSMKEAVFYAKTNAVDGDAVLLSPACASWGMYNNYEERGDDFINLVEEE